ncbi:phytanoyl-CoA dioxygenase [Paenibacillaceae bacterium]|nr:phytanoyl-CoA dioxygenase [Paenibacillaceae bacterium]
MDNALKPASKSFVDSTPLLKHPEALQERAEKSGYLFFRNVLDKDRLLEVRKLILEILNSRGLVSQYHPVDEGIADYDQVNKLPSEAVVGYGVPMDLYQEVQKLEAFHALAHQPALLELFAVLFGEAALPHPRNIARLMLPHESVKTTPPHQDFIHIQGTPATWTAWFPLGDCSKELGGLAILEGSHQEGVLHVTQHQGGAGGLEAILCELDLEWAEGDYQLGDVIVFHSCTVHKAQPNRMGNKIRLSCDFRYQPLSQPIDQGSLQPHGGRGLYTWEELYEGWQDKSIQYYWERHGMTLSEWNETVRWQKDKIC